MGKWFDLMTAQAEPIAKTMTLEMGKPIVESRGEAKYAASFVDYYAESARRIGGELLPTPLPFPHKRLFVRHEPVGPAYGITPWNFPAAMVTRKAAPALAAGCPFILKPAEQSPLTALLLAQLWEQAGGPKGVFQVLPALDPVPLSQVLITDPRIRKLTFTGSTDVGRLLYAQAAQTLEARLPGAGRQRAVPRLRGRGHGEGGQGGRLLQVPQHGPDLHLHEPRPRAGSRSGRGSRRPSPTSRLR